MIASEPTVSMQVLRGLLHLLELEGRAREDVLRGELLPDLDARDQRVPRSTVERILERALVLSADPALGLHWVERLSHHTFGPISLLTSNAPTLRSALELVSRFGTLFSDEPFLELRAIGERVQLRALGLGAQSAAAQRFTAEMIVGGLWRMMRSMWEDAQPEQICFEHAAPAYSGEYTRVFGQAARFGASYTGLELTAAFLDTPSPHSDRELNASLTVLAEKRLRHARPPASYASRVRELLEERAPTRVKMSTVARALGLSVRSLRRRLREEGKSYTEVESDALAGVAARLLHEEQHSIKEVAHRMGFSDAATFHRAFKRWTGATPSSYRNEAR